jgi:adenine phosphoribosyltransferase
MNEELRQAIRSVPDFPKKGIVFRDITTLLKDGRAFRKAVDLLYERFKNEKIDKVVSVESRGFIFGAALAYKFGAGFIPARKPGKLPSDTMREEYDLEYGKDALEMHEDSISLNERVLVVDDLLATGGTISATCRLVERLGGKIVGVGFIIELSFLNGRGRLGSYNVQSLVDYRSE